SAFLQAETDPVFVASAPVTYLFKDEKASDSDKLDGLDSSAFLQAETDPVFVASAPVTYLFKDEKASDSDKLDGLDSSAFLQAETDPVFVASAPATYLFKNEKASDSDKLDGLDSSAFITYPYSTDTFKLDITDVYGRKQIWFNDTNSVLRLGSAQSDGDPTNADSEGIVVYKPSTNNMARIKADRFGLTATSDSSYYYWRVDNTQFFFKDTSLNPIFRIDRTTKKMAYTDGTQGEGKVLTSDSNGVASWQNISFTETDPVFVASAPATYLFKNEKASDSDKLDGLDSSAFLQVSGGTMTGTLNMNTNPIQFNMNDYGIGIGYNANYNYNNGIGIGYNSYNNYEYGIGIGYNTSDNYLYGIGIGYNANTNFIEGIGIGSNAGYNRNYGIGIGDSAYGNHDYGIGIGYNASNNGAFSIGIGYNAQSQGENSIAIGKDIITTENNYLNIGNVITGYMIENDTITFKTYIVAKGYTDGTPYPKSTKEAYDIINSITAKNGEIDHSKLHPFIKDTYKIQKVKGIKKIKKKIKTFNPKTKKEEEVIKEIETPDIIIETKQGRNLSGTTSALVEVVKDLTKRIELLEKQKSNK
ncbi:MAG: hypothetical protein QW474_03505, partial [Candidatus Aenigmatarchaeota archaeon]